MTVARVIVGAVALVVCAATADAQGRPNRQIPQGRGSQPGRPDARRADLEDEVRRNFARAVRERVGLTDDQMLKLGPITRKFEDQRRQIQVDERDARTKLMGLVMVGAESDSVRIRQFIGQLSEVRRRRLQTDEAEQKELAGIMTPLQLAKFLALQENVRRRLEQARPFPGGPPDGMGPDRGAPPRGEPMAEDHRVVRVRVTPLRARIFVDGREVGTGTAIPTLTVGSHSFRFDAAGCETLTETIEIPRGQGNPPPILRTIPNCQP